MIVAVPYKDEQVLKTFYGAPMFKMYEVIGRKITDTMIVEVDNVSTVGFLKSYNVDVILCDEIDEDSVAAIDESGMMAYKGINGEIDTAVFTFLYENLIHDQNKVYSMPEHDHDHDHCHEHGKDCDCDDCKKCGGCENDK